MANENEDVLKANLGAPAADIPDLKKKDKERKKAGATWSGARGAAGNFSGATGGTVARAAASAAGAAGEAAAVGAAEAGGGLFAAMARVLSGLTGTLLGKAVVAAAAFLMLGAAGLVGYGLLKGGAAAGTGALNLGGITDSMKVRSGGNDRVRIAGGGEIRFDPLNKNAAPKPAPKEEAKPEEPAAAAAPETVDAAKAAPQDQLAHNLSGAKLSSSLGGNFGNKNIFAGSNSMAPKFDISKAGMPKITASKGKMNAMAAGSRRASSTARSVGRGKTGRAIGQLKLAKGMSMLGAGASSAEGAAAAANGAFDQQQPVGGDLNAHPPGEVVTPPSTNPPDTSMPSAPDTPPGTGVDPGIQSALSQIGQMADAAKQMKQTGTMLIAIGAVLMVIGAYLIKLAVATSPWGAGLMIAGIALLLLGGGLIYMGNEMLKMADQMAAMAKSMGQALSQSIGNPEQGAAVNYCTDQALQGTPTSQCHPPDPVTNINNVDQQNQVNVERVKHLADDKPVIEGQ